MRIFLKEKNTKIDNEITSLESENSSLKVKLK